MSAFTAVRSVGVKGSDVFSSSGEPLLDLSVKLVRGAEAADLDRLVRAVMAAPTALTLEDMFVLAFHTRAVRGGKGERQLFTELLRSLEACRPELTADLLDLVPQFGSWSDLCRLAEACPALKARAVSLFKSQLERDAADAEAGAGSISLASKWAPREGKAGHALAVELARALFPASPARLQAYRKLVTALNARLKTVEVLMCAGRWADIAPAAVPGRAGKLYSRALLNLVGTKRAGESVKAEDREKLRCPENADRMACRERFVQHFERAREGQAVVHGADTLFPHEVVRKAARGELSESERSQLLAVWSSMVAKAKAGGGLQRTIFMSDFSGSMRCGGVVSPYWVSMALGMLGAEVSEGAFHGKLMTFDYTPIWHTFPKEGDLFSNIQTLRGLGQGLSTNFQAAMELVLSTLTAERVQPGDEPENIVVLTDMGWDQACGASDGRLHGKTAAWQTHVEMFRESFRRAGESLWGEGRGYNPPRIVLWNLSSSDSSDFHATADTPGVALLSGWSPALFEVLLAEGPRELTPLEVLRIELSAPRYDVVRDRVRAWQGP